ncbi:MULTISPECIES: hypothetical protein [unclassified Arthrobacter]|uniref:hypothetical protein n=1 Tax=unclassified Arthrobacter TaxID=235627 RepID=UPI0027D7F80E|nr:MULTISPECIES: hypothetical protein [unclassified Arthrobacter]
MEQNVLIQFETITPADARKLLFGGNYAKERAAQPFDRAKLHHFVDMLTPGKSDWVWRPTVAAIWIDPDGKLRDGLHRLYACALTGQEIDVLVCRQVEWTSDRQLKAEDLLQGNSDMTPEEWKDGLTVDIS